MRETLDDLHHNMPPWAVQGKWLVRQEKILSHETGLERYCLIETGRIPSETSLKGSALCEKSNTTACSWLSEFWGCIVAA
jgi:hypothetical protein